MPDALAKHKEIFQIISNKYKLNRLTVNNIDENYVPLEVLSELLEKLKSVFYVPDDPITQFKSVIMAIYTKWTDLSLISPRPAESLGMALVVQAMVFGDMNDHSGTGLAFSRDPITGVNKISCKYLVKSSSASKHISDKGERNSWQIDKKLRDELTTICTSLEIAYKSMQVRLEPVSSSGLAQY